MTLFCIFSNEKDALEFFQYINGKHHLAAYSIHEPILLATTTWAKNVSNMSLTTKDEGKQWSLGT